MGMKALRHALLVWAVWNVTACGGGGSESVVPPAGPGTGPAAPVTLNGKIWRIDCADASNCIGVGERGSVIRTRDGGRSWAVVAAPTEQQLVQVAMATAEIVYAAESSLGILRSSDGGLRWARVGALPADTSPASSITDLQAHGSGMLLAQTTTVVQSSFGPFAASRQYISTDAGASWRVLDHGVDQVGPAGQLLARTPGLLSLDQGRTWQAFAGTPGVSSADRFLSPGYVDFRTTANATSIDFIRTELDGSSPNGVRQQRYLSLDGGNSFVSTPLAIPVIGGRTHIAQLASYAGGVVYAVVGAAFRGTGGVPVVSDTLLLRSADNGLNWASLGSLPCNSLVFDAEFIAVAMPAPGSAACFPASSYAMLDLRGSAPTATPQPDSERVDGYYLRMGRGPLMKKKPDGGLSTAVDGGLSWVPVPGT